MSLNETGTAEALTVGQLAKALSAALQHNFGLMWVQGELSQLTRASSGHWYFTLKDERAQMRCVMYKQKNTLGGFVPKEGDKLLVRAYPALYEPRGELQLIVEQMRRAGLGDLYEAFVRVREKLRAEGLFETDRKKPLPIFPKRIGVVTSLQAAALADVLRAMKRRCPHVEVIIYPSLVQGAEAPQQLVQALRQAALRQEVQALLLVRGGGSLEDLSAFNDEKVARVVAAMPMPVISGVGHETDVTIVDYVADLRAATPTAAAELVAMPTQQGWDRLRPLIRQMRRTLEHRIRTDAQSLDELSLRARTPAVRLQRLHGELNAHQSALRQAMLGRVSETQRWLEGATFRWRSALPRRLEHSKAQLPGMARRWALGMQTSQARLQMRVERMQSLLQALSAQRVLERGYALVLNADGALVSRVEQTTVGDTVQVRLADGQLDARVQKKQTTIE